MKTGIVVFPGSNCDEDTLYAVSKLLRKEAVKLWHKDTDLKGCEFIILPGGFSYGDYLRSGAIARFSPIMKEITSFAENGGIVLGICNGFQVLCEAGLLPGALLHNVHHQFICRNTYIRAENNETIMTAGVQKGQPLKIPIAHGEGNYFADEVTMKKLNDNGQVLFRYCDENGNVKPEANPNGTTDNIAGICNEAKNVFGLMPHPERASDPLLGNTDGRIILESFYKHQAVKALLSNE
jgi:phosphoribosylformylglycinamidine synthase subunit PurQ / glutaminase